jgi:prolyl-tRNA synthetase
VDDLARRLPELLEDVQKSLFQRAVEFRAANTRHVENMQDLAEAIVQRQFADAFWCGSADCEEFIKQATKATNRCMPNDQPGDSGPCVVCGNTSDKHAIFARAY